MTSSVRVMAPSLLPMTGLVVAKRQKGITMVECLASLALSAVVLAGLNHLLTLTFASQAEADRRYRLHAEAQKIMNQVGISINLAYPKSKDFLQVASGSTSNWLDRYDSTNKKIIYKYDWSVANQALTHTVGDAKPVTLLTNVTNFVAESVVTNTNTPLITVTLTVSIPPDQVTITETRRLGGHW